MEVFLQRRYQRLEYAASSAVICPLSWMSTACSKVTLPPASEVSAAVVTVKKIVDWKVVLGLIGVAVALALLVRHRLKREKLP